MSRVLMIGAGGVATVAAFKIAQNACHTQTPESENGGTFSEFMIASRRKAKCDKIVEDIHKAGYKLDIKTAQVDADDADKRITVFSMQPQAGGNYRQEILGYSLMAALGIKADEIKD